MNVSKVGVDPLSRTPAELRPQIVVLHRARRTIGESSREFGVSKPSVSNWIVQAAADRAKPARTKDVLTSAEREEFSRLRRQVRQLQQERDVPAKATAWFAVKSEKTSRYSRLAEEPIGMTTYWHRGAGR